MINIDENNLDDETITKIGLLRSAKPINASIATEARVFEYPHLENVFIMESDLYGTAMPKDSCFLAFYGKHGLMGKHMRVDALKTATVEDIKDIVKENSKG